jgi:hypothetical protein
MSNTQIHSPYASNVRKASHVEYPADLLKFNAWKNPVESFEEAVRIITSKKLVLGEPAVVPFKFTHVDGSVTLELAFGIGSADVEKPFIRCSVTNDVLNEAVIIGEDEDGNPVQTTLIEVLNDFISRDEAQEFINQGIVEAVKDPEVISQISVNVANSQEITDKIYEHLRWKHISELLKPASV